MRQKGYSHTASITKALEAMISVLDYNYKLFTFLVLYGKLCATILLNLKSFFQVFDMARSYVQIR